MIWFVQQSSVDDFSPPNPNFMNIMSTNIWYFTEHIIWMKNTINHNWCQKIYFGSREYISWFLGDNLCKIYRDINHVQYLCSQFSQSSCVHLYQSECVDKYQFPCWSKISYRNVLRYLLLNPRSIEILFWKSRVCDIATTATKICDADVSIPNATHIYLFNVKHKMSA